MTQLVSPGDSAPATELNRLGDENRRLNEQVKALITVEAKLHAAQTNLDQQLKTFKKLHALGLKLSSLSEVKEVGDEVAKFACYDLNYERFLLFFETVRHSQRFRVVSSEGYFGDEWASKLAAVDFGISDPLIMLAGKGQAIRFTDVEPVDSLKPFAAAFDLDEFFCHAITSESVLLGVIVAGNSKSQKAMYASVANNENSALGLGNLAGQATSVLNTVVSHAELRNERSSLEIKVKERTAELATALSGLRELDVQKSNFFANVSHELRTPLTLSIAPLEELIHKKTSVSPEGTNKHLHVIYNNQLRLLKLINNLLDFSKIDAGKMSGKFQKMELLQAVRFYVGTLESAAESRKIRLTLNTDEDSVPLYLDRDKFEKIIMNLLSNAFKFTPDEGAITVTVKSAGRSDVEISVKDTGSGIPKASLGKLFQRFMQVDSSARRQYEGTGIGLALVKEYVGLHGGRVAVESEEGHGAMFIVAIPKGKEHLAPETVLSDAEVNVQEIAAHNVADFRVEEEEEDSVLEDLGSEGAGSPRPPAESAPVVDTQAVGPRVAPLPIIAVGDQVSAEKPLVLVVDDVPDMRRFVAHVLSEQYRVKTARDGLEGLEGARRIRPDIIVSDVMMPRMTGFELCNAVKKEPGDLARTPVILLSAKGDLGAKIEGLEFGADDYLVKPFNSGELLARVGNLVRLRKQEGALRAAQVELVESKRKLLEGELAVASQVQANILPKQSSMSYPGLSLSGFLVSASACSGDFWLYRRITDDRTVVLLADVTGHGAGSAMVTELAYGALNAILRSNPNLDPHGLLCELNEILLSEPNPLWMTMAVGVFEPSKQRALWANAGHAPIMFREGSGTVRTIASSGGPLGSGRHQYESKVLATSGGASQFLVYSDGLVEATGRDGRQFGMRRLMKVFQAASDPGDMLGRVRKELEEFTGGGSYEDDVTVVACAMTQQ